MTCPNCGVEPYPCPTCGDMQCRCIVPWQAQVLRDIEAGKKRKRPKLLIRVHYQKNGEPYPAPADFLRYGEDDTLIA